MGRSAQRLYVFAACRFTVSGCETDCGSSHIHDLGLVATHKDGKPGFKVYAGGGTGGIPIPASLVADFVEEHDLPAVVEALLRVHQRYSNRRNRNKARIKFVNKRFGPEKFRELFEDAFAEARAMPQRPWQPLEWREGDASAPEPVSPGGVVDDHDGGQAVVIHQELGLFTSDEFDALADLAEKAGAREFRTTRDQNLVIVGLDPARTGEVVDGVRAMGFFVEDAPGSVPNVVACPGTSTCGIGITNSQSFGATIQDAVREYAAKPNLTVKISALGMFDRDWTVDSVCPFVLETIEMFGVDRCMFASNFPVDKLMRPYDTLWDAYKEIVADFSDDERTKLFHGNAVRAYRL